MFRSNQTNKKLYSTNLKSIQLLGTVRITVNTVGYKNGHAVKVFKKIYSLL